MEFTQIHASCVALHSKGVLLMGEPGGGKSDLALRLIDRKAVLVSDDRVALHADGGCLIAKAPDNIAGLLEVRGLGIVRVAVESEVPVSLAVQLVERKAVERLPEPAYFECLGIQIPLLRLYPFDSSSAIQVEMALACLEEKNKLRVGALKVE